MSSHALASLSQDRSRRTLTSVKHGTLQRALANPNKESTLLHQRGWGDSATDSAPPIVRDVVRSPGSPLDAGARGYFEPRLGHYFGNVRVHTDEQAARSARAVNARAYTVGDHIVFDTGRYSPMSHADGRLLLAHELTHVAQQRGQAPSHLEKVGMTRPSDASELEADRLSKAYTLEAKGGESSPQEALANAIIRALAPAASTPQSVSRACACGGGGSGCSCPENEDVATRSVGAVSSISSTGKQAAMDLASLIMSKNPSGEVPTGDEVLTQGAAAGGTAGAGAGAGAAPAPAPAPPNEKCTVTSGPSYSPSGSIPVSTSGGRKSADFDFSASFGTAHGGLERFGLGLRTGFMTGAGIGAYFALVGAIPGAILGAIIGGIAGLAGSDSAPRCCEVHQFIKWDATAAAALGGVPHSGFPAGTPADTWIEDRDSVGKRYGHRSGPFSESVPGNQYVTNGVPDLANGNEFQGHDGPNGPTALMKGEWQFQLKVVDTCQGNTEKASSSVIKVKWS
jgi:hypothetical protein